MKIIFGYDLVLTIGFPLVADLNVQQLGGVIAPEFGHFTQGFGMRLSYVIRSVNFWFARVVYERDVWDVMLDELTAEAEDWRWMILINCAQVGVWFSRGILRLLMLFGHRASSFLLRQMEYDADSYEIKLVGTQAFEDTFRRMHVLGALLKPSYNRVKMGWDVRRELPEDFSALLLKQDSTSPKKCAANSKTPWAWNEPAFSTRILPMEIASGARENFRIPVCFTCKLPPPICSTISRCYRNR